MSLPSSPSPEPEADSRPATRSSSGLFAAAECLVCFLNADLEDLSRAEQRLQAAMREVCDFALKASDASRRPSDDTCFGLYRVHQRPDPMDELWWWYDDHPCQLQLMGWSGITGAPLRPLFQAATVRPLDPASARDETPRQYVTGVVTDRAGSEAAFSLWLLFLLADPKRYRTGRGFVFHSPSGRPMRLLRCTMCKAFFIRSAGRTSDDQNACDGCRLPRKRGPRSNENRARKVAVRVKHLQRAYDEHDRRPGQPVGVDWESGTADHPTFDIYPDGDQLQVNIHGGAGKEEELSLMRDAIAQLKREMRDSRGT